jgi:23S rRNA pseudouridine2605 synthase
MANPSPESRRIRLAKVIARTGRASRREAERLIEDGEVTVNGILIQSPATLVDPLADQVQVSGESLPPQPPILWFAVFKPKGYITTTQDPQGRKTVMELIPGLEGTGVKPVGRLDFDTEGLLLFTNDGETANSLIHPSRNVPKRYLAKIWKHPDDSKMSRLQGGLNLDDGRTAPCKARIMRETDEGGNCWVEITVTEGRNRLVRRMFEHIGHPVSKLRRESFATISLRGLERGGFRALSGDEIARLEEIAEGRRPERTGHGPKYKKGFARPKIDDSPKPLHKKKLANRLRRTTKA